jgi:hypothetical protein
MNNTAIIFRTTIKLIRIIFWSITLLNLGINK